MLSLPMTISLVIPAYNEEQYIADSLRSVLRHRVPELCEIIVVCNACTDRTADIASRFPGVTVLKESRKGTGYARNTGFTQARGDIIAYLDADSRIDETWFPTMLQEFRRNASLVALSGPCQFYDLPAWKSRMIDVWWKMFSVSKSYRQGAIAGGNVAVRRSALQRIGGIDTSIAFWGDDTNLALRLSQIGTVSFTDDFHNFSSARRLLGEGFFKTGTNYALNYVSQTYFQKTFTDGYGERPWENRERKEDVVYS